MSTMAHPESVPPEIVAEMHRCGSCEPDRRPRMFVCAYHEGRWDAMEDLAALRAERDRLREALVTVFAAIADAEAALTASSERVGDVGT